MKIPENLADREVFYDDLIMKCTASQQERMAFYENLRQYYLFGGSESPFNKILPHIDMLTAFLYASETTKFMIGLGAGENEMERVRISVLNRAINDKWMDSNADRVVSYCVTWGLVYNSMIVKLIHRVNEKTKKVSISPFAVHPGSFGVLREDLPFLDQQEAMTHSYYTTKSQLEIDLSGHPDKDVILREAGTTQTVETEEPGGVMRILMGQLNPLSTPGSEGNVEMNSADDFDYAPNIAEDLVQMVELWVWDDATNDYRMVTKVKDGATIFDRDTNFFLPGEHPFINITPNPLPFYSWGMSEVAGLVPLQEWRNERVMQIKKLLDLQVRPPTMAQGMGIVDERAYAMFAVGGILAPQDPGAMNAKVERYAPTIPQDIYQIIHEIDASFSEHSGLPNTIQGKGDVGVRSGKQASELSRLGSARIKKRSLTVEDSLEKIATLYLKLMQKYDTTVYLDEIGKAFSAQQFTQDYVVKVDAHSNSPIFIEDKKQLAFEMLKEKMITRERAIEMIDPPDKEIMKRELKIIEEHEAEAAKQHQQSEIALQQAKHAPPQQK